MDIYSHGSHGEFKDSDQEFELASDLCRESTENHVMREATTLGGALLVRDVEAIFEVIDSDI